MLFRVRLMRTKGRRRPRKEIHNGPYYDGDIQIAEVKYGEQHYKVATLLDGARRGLPELFEPVLDGMVPLAFTLRGYERNGDQAVVQEWHCEMQPRDLR